jgi:hypothetical protein
MQQRAVVLASALLPLCWLSLRIFGVARLFKWLQASSPKFPPLPPSLAVTQALGHAVNVAASHSLFPATCLTRSLLLAWLLRRRGVVCSLRIGVMLFSGQLKAHAWVECEGVPVNDRPDVVAEFAPFNDLAAIPAIAP